jgi:hypothetical protein
MYTKDQLCKVAKELQNRVEKATVTDYEVVLVALTMWKGKRINLAGIVELLLTAFSNNKGRILRCLEIALQVTNDDLIKDIVKDVEKSST